MPDMKVDVAIIGSGPGGLAAGIAAKQHGAKSVLMIERDYELGGILLQCIHNGFGVEIFKEDLPGPSYAQRFIAQALQAGVEVMLDAMVLEITADRRIFITSKKKGIIEVQAKALILAMGCRERTRAQIRIPGTRPAGVYTAGTAQRWVNVEGFMPGSEFVILGSGDIGMIMARRLTFEGAHVSRVLEIMPYISGLMRNYVQCLQDFDIPLNLSHTITTIHGNDRVEAVEVSAVDSRWEPISGTQEVIPCDTVLLSVGLIPENELSRQAGVMLDPLTNGPIVDSTFQTNIPGIFAAGNVVHVYDLVDWVTQAGYQAGESAARYAAAQSLPDGALVPTKGGKNVHYVVPQHFRKETLQSAPIEFQMRVTHPIEKHVRLEATSGGTVIHGRTYPYARPGEMVTLTLQPRHVERFENLKEITFRATVK